MSVPALDNVALYKISVDGAEVDEVVADAVTEIRVLNYLALPDMCTFETFFGVEDFEKQPFDIGKALEVALSSSEGTTTQTLFRGEIVTLEPEFAHGGVALTVRALDRAHRLQRARRIRTFQKMTISQLVDKVVREAGLTPVVGGDIKGLGIEFEHIQQDNENDLEFLWRLARRVGADIYVDGDKVHFTRAGKDVPVELEWPTQLHTFRPRVTAVQQVDEVSMAWNDGTKGSQHSVSKKQPGQVSENGIPRRKVADAFGQARLHISSAMLESQEEGNELAQAMLDRLANGYIAAEGECQGDPKIRAGCLLEISGVGQAFSGSYLVQSSTHILRGGGSYVTTFTNSPVQTIRGALGGTADELARHLGTQLTVGIVSNTQDETGLGRVKVTYPHYNDTDESAWARVAFANAGTNRGQVMFPQVGDEVLIAFLHSDTRFPIVLGSLYNGAHKSGEELLSKVGKTPDGSYVLRSDARIDMKATKDIIVVGEETGTITLDKDLALASKNAGLTLTSKSDMGLTSDAGLTGKARQDITITSDMANITVKASAGTVTLKGLSVEVSADTTLKLSGAMVQVQGTQIMLG
jgi:phage protein D/phage baseplate assembly protein gpV